jgi:hypothetical protein
MLRQSGRLGLLTLLVGLILGGLALSGRAQEPPSRLVKPRIVATVTALEPRGLAIIQTHDGVTYEVIRERTWQVGDTVTCEQYDGTRVSWRVLDCRKVS